MAEKEGWRNAARKVQRENKYDLQTVPGCFIVVKKWTITAQEKMAQEREGFELDASGMPKHMKEGDLSRFHILGIRYGIADHNFLKDDGSKEDFANEEFLKGLIEEFPEAEEEIFDRIAEYNHPLAKRSVKRSETVQSGS